MKYESAKNIIPPEIYAEVVKYAVGQRDLRRLCGGVQP